jgi:uncharacterized membrane-anchored protein
MPTRKNIILVIIAFQILIVAGMFVKAYYPIFMGKEVKLAAYGQDPRDLFRGNYSEIRYDFSSFSIDSVKFHGDTSKTFKYGDWLYAELQAQPNGYYKAVAFWENLPEDGKIYLRVTPTNELKWTPSHQKDYYWAGYANFKAGIESFFANPDKATEIDKLMNRRDSLQGFAKVMIAPNGVGRIKELDFEVIKQ